MGGNTLKDQATKLRLLVSESEKRNQKKGVYPVSVTLSPKNTRVIAVTSGKGGVGKTTLAVNLALLLSRMPAKVLLVDADLGLANVDVMLDIDNGRHLGHLLMTNCTAEEVAADGPNGIKVISGGSGLRDLADAGSEGRAIILEKLAAYCANFDYVVVDTSPGIGEDVVDFLQWADDLLLVTTTEPTSITDAYAALKVASTEMPGKDVVVVVNSADTVQASQAVTVINNVANKFLGRHCNCWYPIEHDALVGRAIRERKPFVDTYPKSRAAECLERLASELYFRRSPVGATA